MKKLLTLLLLFFTIGVVDSYGSHLMGGEITWICQRTGPNTGRFKFTVKLYRDCNGISAPPSVSLSSNAPGLGGGVFCNQVSVLDLSPVGPGCPTCAVPGGKPNAVLECIYESSFINITGVPPATGWYFSYSDCCRNGVTNLANTGSGYFTLRALMFPYNATNTNPCYDNSPRFAERPQLATMIGNLTTYSANAVDEDGDSLHYDWGQPLDGSSFASSTNYPFAANYTYQTPLPNPIQNPLNQSATLDPNSGTVTFTPFTVGSFVTVTKVSSFRCGIKIAEVYREIQISLLPSVIVANNTGLTIGNTPPDINAVVLPPSFQSYGVNQFVDTVFAGDTVKLPITAYDFEHVTTNPTSAFQSVSFDVTGIELDATETANTGACPFAPCAYVDKAVPTPYTIAAASIQFNWVTDCNHLAKTVGCISLKNTYNFVVKALDNFCPSPSVNFYTFSIVVVAPPEMDPSLIYCADVQSNGNVTLTWDIPSDTGVVDTNKYFHKHYIYRSVANGPFALLDSDSVITNLSYTDLTANANTGSIRYYLETKSGCDLRARQQSDTISTMFLQVSQVGTNASLTWNPLDVPNPIGSHSKYYIYKETPVGSGTFVLLDSTSATTYLDPVTVCNDSINYYIRLHNDIRNCDSKSNIEGAQLQAAAPVINPPSLRCVSVLPNEDIQISWVGTTDTASYFSSYEVYHSLSLGGPYTLVGSVTNYAANTFTHVGAQGNSQPHYYHVTTKAGCDATTVTESTTTSANLCSMKLNLNNANVGFADLTWNAISTPLPATSVGLYSVYRRVTPTVAWTLRGTTANLTFRDTVTLCDTIIEYKVTIDDASGCISTSSDSAARFTSQGDIIANPSLRCLAVQANGDVQLSWLAPSDPDNFFSKYEVYSSSNAAGPFTLVGTVNTYNAGGFLHTGAGANSGSKYYYVKTYSGCTGLADNGSTSDTLKTMYLTVNNATLGSAILTWNAMHNPALPSAAATYTIKKRATGVGGYTTVGTTSNLTYTDNISVCNDPLEYIVELTDNAPCTSVSSAANATFTYLGNVINNPDLRCLSVQNNGQILLSFIPPAGASTNFNEYEIWRDDGTGFVKYDSVSTFGALNYTDINANGNNQSYSYYMLSQSGCTGQVNSLANSQTLSSIYLTTTPVLGQANLNWTGLAATIPVTSTTGQYDIYSSYNAGGSLQLYGDTNKLVYSQPIVNCDTTLRYQIKLVDNSGCVSTSNVDTNDYTYIGNIINNPDLRCVSVQNNGQIVLNYLAPSGSSADFNEYEIWRDNGTGYVKYDSISTFGNGSYTDISANGNNQSYGYYMLTQSGCTGQVNSASNSQTLNSIYLTTTPVLGQANLNWTALTTPIPVTSTTGQYDIFSSYNAGGSLQLYGDTNKLVYSQPISNCDTTLRYQIKLVDNSGCISTSNVDTNDYTYIGNVINNPDLRCVSVQNNGQIVLNYLAPSGSSADFNEFEIWRDNGAGYVKYDSVSTFGNGTYTDINANGNNQSYGYYMLTQSGCTGQVNSTSNSQTLNSIYLTTSPVLGQANLNWTALSTPIPATSTTGQYDIYSSYNSGGSLQLYGDTNKLVYSQPISNCDTTLRYQIKLVDNSGCISTSNVDTNDYTYIGNVINNPDLRCVSVQNNGQILLNFIPPAGSSADFNEFEIWRDNGAGYVKYDSISSYTATTYTDINANGNTQTYGYYMLTQSGCTGQVNSASNSQSLNSIYLTTTPVLGQANLNWTALSTPIPATSTTGQYDIYSSYNSGGSLQLFGDTNQLLYFQPVSNCDTTLRYQIKLVDNSGCISTSNVDTNDYTYIGNVINNPDLRCVSVQNNGQILLNFIPPVGSSTDFNEFEIWRDNGTGYVKYDSISNYSATTYTDINANGNNQSYGYYMLTQSGCTGQVNSASNSQSLNSIYLTSTPVLGQANLNWTALSSPLPGTSVTGQYDIFTSYNASGNLQILGDTNQLVYFEGINNCDTTLRHQVKVTDNSGCVSVSNVDTNLFTYIGNVINNPDLRCVSVQSNGQIELSFIPPSGSNINFNEYEIWRDNGTGYVKYDSVSTFGAVNYTDINANGNNQSYGYYMLTQSGCTGQVNSTLNSQSLNSIYLTTTPVLGTANLNWTALSSPLPGSSTTGQYDVYSSYNSAGTLQFFGDTTQLVYSQPIQNCDTTLRYQIKVVDNSGCISTSNVDTNLYTYIGNVIDNPEMRCVTVNSPSGQTQLTWVNPTPTSWINFNQYDLYRNTGSGFTLIDSVQSNGITSYTDVNANGYNGSVSYYLVTKSGCTGKVDNGTLGNAISSLYLKVTGGNTTTATLNWNAPSNPLLPTSSGSYLVERQQPAGTGTWTTAANVTTTSFTEPLTLCIDSVNYRVSINDNIGCTSMSNYDGETFVDHTIPVSPSLRCASVQTNGDVVLNWVAPVDTGMKFGSYLIYSSNNVNGPFNAIQNITNYNTTTYTHVGANAQNQSVYYYILTKTACGGEVSPVSDTLKTMKVNVINNNGVAVIRWNPLHDPELSTATQSYNVHKEYPTGVWNVIGTTTAPDYIWYDTINVCSAIINYFVSTGDALGCGSNSSTDGDLFKDITKPTVSLLDTVSIDTATQSIVSISWLPSPSGDVEGYILYHFNGASWDSIGSVYGINTNSFQITDPSVQSGPQLYSITAYDSCLNRSNIGSAHSTLFLKAKLDVCKYAIDLQWNPYINMVGGISQYNIYASENGGPFTLLASVPSNNITYSHNTLNNHSYYCYYVQAVGNVAGRTSTSTRACATADLLTLPTYGYVRKATVIDDRRVLVTAYVDTTDQPDVSKYKLQRAFDKGGPFTTVGVQSYTGNPDLTFADFTARTDQYSYYYRLVTVDSCGNEVLKSNMARTILLSGQARYNLTNELKFNDYSEWLGGVNNYALFRKVDDVWQTAPAAILPFGQQTYMDDVSSIYQTSGKFCYRVEAYEGAGNMYGYTDTSSSNEFCLIQEPHLFVPTAFTPGGKNTIFKPEYIFIDAKNYFFVVFNRWGQKVYESRVPGEGWNGEFDGKIAPEGTYVYTVRIFGTNGQEIEKSGSVTLLR